MSSSNNPQNLLNVTVHPPNSSDPSLSSTAFPYEEFLGTWHVAASSLPLWKSRKNVTLSYSRIDDKPPSECFLDTVHYNSEGAEADAEPSEVIGVDHVDVMDEGKGNGARWTWKGQGLLQVASSSWQVLGYRLSTQKNNTLMRDDWAVIYFSSTLFTPAGLDILVRYPAQFNKETMERIIEVCKGSDDEELSKVSEGIFRVHQDQ